MKLTKSTDFALRVVIYLASNPNSLVTMPEMAQKLQIPYNNLIKLVRALSKADLIETKQGKNGGVRLGQAPQDISLKTVFDIIEGPTRLSDCVVTPEICRLSDCCKLRVVFDELETKIDAMFDDVRIDQLTTGGVS